MDLSGDSYGMEAETISKAPIYSIIKQLVENTVIRDTQGGRQALKITMKIKVNHKNTIKKQGMSSIGPCPTGNLDPHGISMPRD